MKISRLDNKLKINIDFTKFIKNTLIFTALNRIKNYFVGMFFIKKNLECKQLKGKIIVQFYS